MNTIRALEIISLLFLIFELKMLVSYIDIEHERKKYLIATAIISLPAIFLSIISMLYLIIVSYSTTDIIISLLLLLSSIIFEIVIITKIKNFSDAEQNLNRTTVVER